MRIEAPERCSNPAKPSRASCRGAAPGRPSRRPEHRLGGEGGLGEEPRTARRRPTARMGPRAARRRNDAMAESPEVRREEFSARSARRDAAEHEGVSGELDLSGALMCSSIRRRLRPRRAESERVSYQYSAADARPARGGDARSSGTPPCTPRPPGPPGREPVEPHDVGRRQAAAGLSRRAPATGAATAPGRRPHGIGPAAGRQHPVELRGERRGDVAGNDFRLGADPLEQAFAVAALRQRRQLHRLRPRTSRGTGRCAR